MSEKPSVTVLWTIENFYHCPQEEYEDLTSPAFYVDSLCQSEWELRVYPNTDNEIKAFLYNYSYNQSNRLFIDYEISFLSKDGSVLWVGDEQNIEINIETSYEIAAYPSSEEVLENRVEEYLPQGALTLRCRIWKSRKSLAYPILYNAFTRIEIERRIFHWSIEEFSQLRINGRRTTHRIRIGDEEPTFRFELFLTGASANKTNISIDIKQVNKSISRFFSSCKISVLNTEGSILKESEVESYFFEPEDSIWKFPQFLTKNELTAEKHLCLEDDILNLLCNLTFTTGEEYANIDCVTSLPPWVKPPLANDASVSKHLQQTPQNDMPGPAHDCNEGETLAVLQKDFLSLYKDRSLSDFELRSGSTSFPVHKNVLGARSPVFKAMLGSGMKEGDASFMAIPDVDADTLDKLLVFIYTGNVENMKWSSASKLYYAADKYDVFSLKQKCSSFLSFNISDSNVCEILLLADRHNDDALKSSVHDFMVLNDDKIIRSKVWMQFLRSNPVLAAETMQLIYSKKLDMLAKR